MKRPGEPSEGMSQTDVDLKTQLVRFVVTGAGSGALDFGLTYLLQAAVGSTRGWPRRSGSSSAPPPRTPINRRWTFRAERARPGSSP